MATKKQKSDKAYQDHLNYMEELRLSGLEAQRKDRENREKKKEAINSAKAKAPHSKNTKPSNPDTIKETN